MEPFFYTPINGTPFISSKLLGVKYKPCLNSLAATSVKRMDLNLTQQHNV